MSNEEGFVEIAEVEEKYFTLAQNLAPYVDPDTIYTFAIMFLAKSYSNNDELYEYHHQFLKELQSQKNNQRKDMH